MKESIKWIVTTSNKYHHLLKIFIYLFNKNVSENIKVEVVGYDKPGFDLPSNFTFHSLGKQTDTSKDFSNDLRPYFEKQGEWFIWFFEDSWVKEVDWEKLDALVNLTEIEKVGRVNLTYAARLQDFIEYGDVDNHRILENTQTARYRICTQPSIWNKQFLLQYLKPNMSPWDFESQDPQNDGWRILGPAGSAVLHNEGVTRHNIYRYNLSGIDSEQLREMRELKLI